MDKKKCKHNINYYNMLLTINFATDKIDIEIYFIPGLQIIFNLYLLLIPCACNQLLNKLGI